MANVLEQQMHTYFSQLSEEEKRSVIQMLKTFLKGRQDNSGRVSIEQYNRELEEAEQQIATGNFISQEELEKEMEKW